MFGKISEWVKVQLVREEARKQLGLKAGYTAQELKKAVKAFKVKHHPDKGGERKLFELADDLGVILEDELFEKEGDPIEVPIVKPPVKPTEEPIVKPEEPKMEWMQSALNGTTLADSLNGTSNLDGTEYVEPEPIGFTLAPPYPRKAKYNLKDDIKSYRSTLDGTSSIRYRIRHAKDVNEGLGKYKDYVYPTNDPEGKDLKYGLESEETDDLPWLPGGVEPLANTAFPDLTPKMEKRGIPHTQRKGFVRTPEENEKHAKWRPTPDEKEKIGIPRQFFNEQASMKARAKTHKERWLAESKAKGTPILEKAIAREAFEEQNKKWGSNPLEQMQAMLAANAAIRTQESKEDRADVEGRRHGFMLLKRRGERRAEEREALNPSNYSVFGKAYNGKYIIKIH
jgi:hypothetical protein